MDTASTLISVDGNTESKSPLAHQEEGGLKVEKQSKGRDYAILVDYRNLRLSLTEDQTKLKDLHFVKELILKRGGGVISFCFVFVPHHEMARVPVQQISNIYNYDIVSCPQTVGRGTVKDSDTVDAHLERMARRLIQKTSVTDIVIISGDADFYRLADEAWCSGKRVLVVAGKEALSVRFKELEGLTGITIEEI